MVRNCGKALQRVTPDLEAWLLAAAESPVTPLTAADFKAIRERAGARSAAKEVVMRRAMHGHRDLPRRLLESTTGT